MQFSTKDDDNDYHPGENRPKKFKGAWWYRDCHGANLSGRYLGRPHASFADGVNLYTFRGYHYSFKRSKMKIKPKSKCKHDKPLLNGCFL